jgi:hypothetical protein
MSHAHRRAMMHILTVGVTLLALLPALRPAMAADAPAKAPVPDHHWSGFYCGARVPATAPERRDTPAAHEIRRQTVPLATLCTLTDQPFPSSVASITFSSKVYRMKHYEVDAGG